MIRLTEHGRWVGELDEFGRLHWTLTEHGRLVLTAQPLVLVCFPFRLFLADTPIQIAVPTQAQQASVTTGRLNVSRMATGRPAVRRMTAGRLATGKVTQTPVPTRRCLWRSP